MNAANADKVRLATGQIENVAVKPDRYAVLVKGNWYSAFEKDCPVCKGEMVAIAYVQNEQWKDIKAIDVLEEKLPVLSSTVPRGFSPSERETMMVYSVALKAAASCWAAVDHISSDGVKKLADNFAEWLLAKAIAKPSTAGTVGTDKGVSK